MKALSVIVFSVLFLLFGCASTPCPPHPLFPTEDIIIVTEYGPVRIFKETLIPDNYYTVPEWEAFIKSYYESLRPTESM